MFGPRPNTGFDRMRVGIKPLSRFKKNYLPVWQVEERGRDKGQEIQEATRQKSLRPCFWSCDDFGFYSYETWSLERCEQRSHVIWQYNVTTETSLVVQQLDSVLPLQGGLKFWSLVRELELHAVWCKGQKKEKRHRWWAGTAVLEEVRCGWILDHRCRDNKI